ncbi:hypothetical protein L345_17724 [Ophiophagus hannah]|uniref:Uncharacterized protein n=1 Tax=Ophiophagus hannah TaxID=8665 RepID=V8N350_OPHHA|nr:hypothetical protein L345_17724 [Ophiophagus hannah]
MWPTVTPQENLSLARKEAWMKTETSPHPWRPSLGRRDPQTISARLKWLRVQMCPPK